MKSFVKVFDPCRIFSGVVAGLFLLLAACSSSSGAPSSSSHDGGPGATDGSGGGGPLSHTRVDNPFQGASFYLNPEYAAKVEAARQAAPAPLSSAMEKVKSFPTAIWLDRIATIEGGVDSMGISTHLDEALRQQAQSPETPVLVTFVVYDLPGRDCAAFASNGELPIGPEGLAQYKEQYIGGIIRQLSASPAYQQLRIVTVIEPDSLPNLVTNLGIYDKCRQAADGYKEGVRYAVSELSKLDNVYIYLDIAHSGWLGWEHPATAAKVYQDTLGAQLDSVRGFATNVANYSTLQEAFNPYNDVTANQSLIVGFYEWNRMIDEVSFVTELRKYFPTKSFLIDTSRNGWKSRGSTLPEDARTHRGNWCNVSGAGIGESPRANPLPSLPYVDAFFFIKPPGESDGTSDSTATTANSEGKRFDPMCGQAPVERPYAPGKSIATDALPGAPHAGHWFDAQFRMLVENATPGL